MHWRQEGDRGHSRHQGAEPHHPVIVNPIPSRVARDGHLRTHALPPRACPGGISHVKAFYGQRQKQNSLSPLPPGRGKTPVLQPWSAQHLGAVTQIGQDQQRQAGHQAALVLSWPDREALLGHPPAAKHPPRYADSAGPPGTWLYHQDQEPPARNAQSWRTQDQGKPCPRMRFHPPEALVTPAQIWVAICQIVLAWEKKKPALGQDS